MSRIVLIGSVPPCDNYSGGLFLQGIVRSGALNLVGAIAVQAPSLRPAIPADLVSAYPTKIILKVDEFYDPSSTGVYSAEIAIREAERRQRIAEQTKNILEFCSEHRADEIWIVLEGQTLIFLADALINEGRYPVRVQVMDPPDWQLRAANVGPEVCSDVLLAFDAVLSRATACAAASWNMAETYRERYQVAAVPIVPALPSTYAQRNKRSTTERSLRVGFAGQAYASEEFSALVLALAAEHREKEYGPVELHVFTRDPFDVPDDFSRQVYRHPWKNQETLIQDLSQLDLLYCPYWFDLAYRVESQLCFPSKLSSYLAAGRPVLFHGRRDSSPAKFLLGGRAAFFCFRPGAESLRTSFRAALSNAEEYNQRARDGASLFQSHLTLERLSESIHTFLNIK